MSNLSLLFASHGGLDVLICGENNQAAAGEIKDANPDCMGPEPSEDLDYVTPEAIEFMEDLMIYQGANPEKYVVVVPTPVLELINSWLLKVKLTVDSITGDLFKIVTKPIPHLVATKEPKGKGIYLVRGDE